MAASPSCSATTGTHGVESAVDIALLGRYYERIADHAVSVANRVVFVVTGQYPVAVEPDRSSVGPATSHG